MSDRIVAVLVTVHVLEDVHMSPMPSPLVEVLCACLM